MLSLIKYPLIAALACLLMPFQSFALEPFECLLLVNRGSSDSLTLANYYATLRNIPDENVVYLDIDKKFYETPYKISFEEFMNSIFEPTVNAMETRGLSNTIKAWIYSTDFPNRVVMEADEIMSIQGATLTANDAPATQAVQRAEYHSPFYAGPSPTQSTLQQSRSFDRIFESLNSISGYPSMMLSFTQPGGIDLRQSMDVLSRGQASDGSAPNGKLFFVKTADPHRSEPRHWQFEPAAQILRNSGLNAVVTEDMPAGATNIIGLQVGIQRLDVSAVGRFLPGAMAEHMTSWGASFDKSGHTRATEWLAAGATATSGTVTEPYALWPKFPTAFFFHHYRSGCTIIESFFQSILSPVQILLIGDPLARPWARAPNVTVINIDQSDPISGETRFAARVFQNINPELEPRMIFLLNGRTIARDLTSGQIGMDTVQIPDGHHTLRAVITTNAPLNIKPYGKLDFVVDNRGRVPRMEVAGPKQPKESGEEFIVQVSAGGQPTSIGLRSRYLILAESKSDADEFKVNSADLGLGKVPLQAFAKYEDGEATMGLPIVIEIIKPDL